MNPRYTLRPQADADLEQHAYYLATQANAELGHRFLAAARDTFTLLATQPRMGRRFRVKNPRLDSLRVFSISGFAKMLVFYLPSESGIDIVRVVHGSRNLLNLLKT